MIPVNVSSDFTQITSRELDINGIQLPDESALLQVERIHVANNNPSLQDALVRDFCHFHFV